MTEAVGMEEFRTLARLAVTGSAEDVAMFVRRVAYRVRNIDPRASQALMELCPAAGSVCREARPAVDLP